MFVKYIQQETGTRVQIKGIGSGFVDQETGRESDEPMHIHITCVSHFFPSFLALVLYADDHDVLFTYSGPDDGQVARAKVLTEDLLEVVRAEHAKVKAMVYQQQMELHQAQAQYAAYSAYAVCIKLYSTDALLLVLLFRPLAYAVRAYLVMVPTFYALLSHFLDHRDFDCVCRS